MNAPVVCDPWLNKSYTFQPGPRTGRTQEAMKRVWWTVAIVGSCFGRFCSRVSVLLLERGTMCTKYGRILGVRLL